MEKVKMVTEPTITMTLKEYEKLKGEISSARIRSWKEIDEFKSSVLNEQVLEGIRKENEKQAEYLIKTFKGLSLWNRLLLAIKNK